jgi:hypothetical protein
MEEYIKWTLLTLTIIGLIICVPIYFFQLEPINLQINNASQDPVQITDFNIHVGNDEPGKNTYSLKITFMPTETTKPDQGYRFVIDNSNTTVNYDIQWNQLELGSSKPKTLTVDISSDQYIAIIQKPQYNLVIYEWKPKHNFFLILPWIITLVLFSSIIIYRTIKPKKQSTKLKQVKARKQLKSGKLKH